MKKPLLESGSLKCPYCKYNNLAQEDSESKGDIKAPGIDNFTYDTWRACPLCGWQEYKRENQDEWWEAAEKAIDIDPDEDPVAFDKALNKLLPPNPLNFKPKLAILIEAKRIVKMVNKAPDEEGFMSDFIIDVWAEMKDKFKTYDNFLRGYVKFILNDLTYF
jgi:hypothetical protein